MQKDGDCQQRRSLTLSEDYLNFSSALGAEIMRGTQKQIQLSFASSLFASLIWTTPFFLAPPFWVMAFMREK